jgi:ketosteroid isomerase-like protein
MRSTIPVVALLFGCLTSVAVPDEVAAGAEATLNSWASAWRAGDVDRVLSFYERSKDVVAIASSGRRYDGALGVRRMYEEAFNEAEWRQVELRDVKVLRDGNLAWATCRFQAEALVKPSDAAFVFTSQGSVVLRRSGDGWKIVLEHFSPIASEPRIQLKD